MLDLWLYVRTHVRLLSVLICSICVYGYFFVSSSDASAGEIGEISATTSQSLSSLYNLNTLSRHLGLGMSGGDVRDLQRFYSTDSAIYPHGLITGYYGPKTREATKRYQRENGLTPTGYVGHFTLLLLRGITIEKANGSANSSVSVAVYHQYLLTTSDALSAPVMTAEVVRASAHSATFTWMTDKPAIARVYYSTSLPFAIRDAPSFTATGGLSTYQSVTVSGLPSNTTLSYMLESTGANGQESVNLEKLFTTSK